MIETVPFVSLKIQHQGIRAEMLEAWRGVLEREWYIMGEEGKAFEAAFATYCGTSECLGVGNGLDALILSLKAFGIGPGDEVIVPAHTFIATANAVSWIGARPVLADVDPRTANLTAEMIERADPKGRAKAVIPVHLYGADLSDARDHGAGRTTRVPGARGQRPGAGRGPRRAADGRVGARGRH